MPVVFYRLSDATLAALYDRCPHRWAPPSEGHVERNIIVCAYPGMEFNTEGLHTKSPTQHIKRGARTGPALGFCHARFP